MKFFEFGKNNEKTLLWLCGFGGCWTPILKPFIEIAQKEYHVIVDAYDGFNPSEPDKIFQSIQEEAKMAADFICSQLGGKIDVIYGVSLGGMVANEILMDRRIQCRTLIADGYTIMTLPNIKAEWVKKCFYQAYAKLEYCLLHKHLGLVANVLGRKEEQLKKAFYMEVKKESLYNCEYSLNGYRYKFKTFNRTNAYIWHADVEKTAIKRVRKLSQKGIHFTHKIFHNVGHGGLVANQPKKLLEEISKIA